MGSLSTFERPQKLINWGKAHIEESYSEFRKYMAEDGAFPAVKELDAATGETVCKIVQHRPLDEEVERHATAALNDLRHSFDQSIFAVCKAIGAPVKDGHYPWATSPAGLEIILEKRKPKTRIDDRLLDTIRGHEPYGTSQTYAGGDDTIREISKIANSKHTVGLVLGCNITSITSGVSFDGPSMVSLKHPRWNTEKNEIEVLRYRSSAPPTFDEKTRTVFDVFFDSPGILQKVSAFAALRLFAQKAQHVLDTLKARAIELGAI